MPTHEELLTAVTGIISTAKTGLATPDLRTPTMQTASAFQQGINLMVRTETNFDKQLKVSIGAAGATRNVAIAAEVRAGKFANVAKQTVDAEIRDAASRQLAAQLLAENAPKADAIVGRIIEGLQTIEVAIDRLKLEVLEPASLRSVRSLEDLMAEAGIQRDLEGMSAAELQQFFDAELRISPEKAVRILPMVARISKERGSPEFARSQARARAVPSRDGEFTRESAIYLAIWNKCQAVKSSQISPDVDVFETQIAPQLQFLTRSVIGVDARSLSPSAFEAYSRSFKAGERLSRQQVVSGWILRTRLPIVAVDSKSREPKSFAVAGAVV